MPVILHGHDHHAAHYRWPDPKLHAADIEFLFDGNPPAEPRRYDVLSCGAVCWVIRVRGNRLIAAHLRGEGWTAGEFFEKSLRKCTARAGTSSVDMLQRGGEER